MDKEEANQENTPALLSNSKEESPPPLLHPPPRKQKQQPPVAVTVGGGGGGGGDRLKRDEWSEGAVSSLLEAYETKWILRNRAKLKGQDWEDVAKYVSARANCTKSPKTQTQCKNKIESMKKRYRSESATASAVGDTSSSSWPLFPRLDLLLRGSAPPHPPPFPLPIPLPLLPAAAAAVAPTNAPLVLLEPSLPPQSLPTPPPPPPPPPPAALPQGIAQNSHNSNGFDRDRGTIKVQEDGVGTKLWDDDHHMSGDKNAAMDTDSSTPALYMSEDKEELKSRNLNKKKKRRRSREGDNWEVGIAESIKWLAQVVVRSEQARMDTMRELERMRAEADAKRGELDLKRTEIIANTQLEIARLFAASAAAGVNVGKGSTSTTTIDSSLRIGRS